MIGVIIVRGGLISASNIVQRYAERIQSLVLFNELCKVFRKIIPYIGFLMNI